MDRSVEIRTPESIEFRYELAGLGSRFLALAVDQAIQIVALIAIFAALIFAASKIPGSASSRFAASGYAQSIGIAIVVTIVFLVFYGYFIAFEALWNGQTPGKRLLGIRVVQDGGYPIDFGASLIRNLIRVGEALLGYYVLSIVSALLSHENKRLGDIAAGTIVVREASLSAPRRPLVPQPSGRAPVLQVTDEERALIKRFIERRDTLEAHRRDEIAAQLAARLRNRVSQELARLSDEALLERIEGA